MFEAFLDSNPMVVGLPLAGEGMQVTIVYPPPKGKRKPGGSILRKSRLRKKQFKYLDSIGHVVRMNGSVKSITGNEATGDCTMTFTAK